MGSKATEDISLMKELFKELKKRDLYFLDNLVTDKSVSGMVSEKIGLPIARRSVFLDNNSDEAYIEGQLLETADIAAKTGWAVAVGHDRIRTVEVLRKVLPKLKETGFELTYVSELVR